MVGYSVDEIVAGIWSWQRRPRGLRPSQFGVSTSYAVALERDLLHPRNRRLREHRRPRHIPPAHTDRRRTKRHRRLPRPKGPAEEDLVHPDPDRTRHALADVPTDVANG